MNYRYKPSRKQAREFAQTMDEIKNFCVKNDIDHSKTYDSYYFTIDGQAYRVSNHTIETSNKKAYNEIGIQIRSKYHDDTRNENVKYIHASKTRIIEIYNNLKAGYELNGKGKIIL